MLTNPWDSTAPGVRPYIALLGGFKSFVASCRKHYVGI